MHAFALIADETFAEGQLRRGVAVKVAPPLIEAIVPLEQLRDGPPLSLVRLPPGTLLAPGFIDTQVNGGGDVLLNASPTIEGIATIAAAHRRFGVTSLLPTLITDAPEVLDKLGEIAAAAMAVPGVRGFHLEGPHIAPGRPGVHRPDLIVPLNEAALPRLLRFGDVGRSMVTLAPECAGTGMIRRLVDAGLIVSLGHSEATAEDVARATAEGAHGVTHLFNAMSQMSPREPGLVGSTLDPGSPLMGGIIADGHHVHAAHLRLAAKAMGPRLMLVSDAMPTVGGRLTAFDLQGRRIALRDGRLSDSAGTLAGAHLGMSEAVARFWRVLGADDAALMAALTAASTAPARLLGLEAVRGQIAPGLMADIVALRRDTFEVVQTWQDGLV